MPTTSNMSNLTRRHIALRTARLMADADNTEGVLETTHAKLDLVSTITVGDAEAWAEDHPDWDLALLCHQEDGSRWQWFTPDTLVALAEAWAD